MILRLGVVLLPDASTDAFVRGISHGLFPNSLRLGDQRDGTSLSPHPHVSLFHLMVESDAIPELRDSVFAHTPPSLARQIADEIRVLPTGWGFLESPRTRSLIAMQRAVLHGSDKFRAQPVSISWQRRFTEQQTQAYQRWGYPNIGSAWDPHFSFGILPGPAMEQHLNFRWNWHARSLAIVRIGNNGTAAEILMERELTIM